jgi:hypothetical protein
MMELGNADGGRRVNVMNNSGPKTVRSKAKWRVLYVQQTSWLSDVMGCDGETKLAQAGVIRGNCSSSHAKKQ